MLWENSHISEQDFPALDHHVPGQQMRCVDDRNVYRRADQVPFSLESFFIPLVLLGMSGRATLQKCLLVFLFHLASCFHVCACGFLCVCVWGGGALVPVIHIFDSQCAFWNLGGRITSFLLHRGKGVEIIKEPKEQQT